MRFHVYSIEQMNGLALWHPPKTFSHAIISVTDPDHTEHGNPVLELPIGPQTKGVLRLKFVDRAHGPDIFTKEMARLVVKFACQHDSPHRVTDAISRAEAMLVHCHAGLSRSHAIAAGLTKGLYGLDDTFHFQQGNPSPLVYAMILEACK